MKYFFAFFLFLFNSLLYAETHTVRLGNTQVKIIKKTAPGKIFVHLHENEQTALKSAKMYLAREGGTLITLKHSGERNVVFYLKKVRYEFDPNRIFTDRGIRNTLKKHGHYSPQAHRVVKGFARRILALLPKGKVIAVHNNREYSMKDYFPYHPLATDVKTVHYIPFTSYRNFYFVTQAKDYERLKKLRFNVALQAKHASNDGSLSYYLGKKNYINIEAAFHALAQQLKMLYHA